MENPSQVNRRTAMGRCVAAAGSAYALSEAAEASAAEADEAKDDGMLFGKLGDSVCGSICASWTHGIDAYGARHGFCAASDTQGACRF